MASFIPAAACRSTPEADHVSVSDGQSFRRASKTASARVVAGGEDDWHDRRPRRTCRGRSRLEPPSGTVLSAHSHMHGNDDKRKRAGGGFPFCFVRRRRVLRSSSLLRRLSLYISVVQTAGRTGPHARAACVPVGRALNSAHLVKGGLGMDDG